MPDLKQGWLSPTGEFQECRSFDHIDTARSITQKLGLPCIDTKSGRIIPEDDKLMDAGYAYIGISSFMCHEWRIGWRRHLTPEQIRFLRPYFENQDGLPVNELCIDRWREEVQDG